MGDAHFTAVLFYAASNNPVVRAGGRMPSGSDTKILWSAPEAGVGPLVIQGHDLHSGRTFTQRVDGGGAGQYPSVPNVPEAGCWTLTESVRGSTLGAITVPVAPAIESG